MFSDYQPICILSENSFSYDYVSFKIDIEQYKILLFVREQQDTKRLFVKILEVSDPEMVVLDCEILDLELKGIFLSNQQYKLIDGHVYYGNNIVKLRYDLMTVYGTGGINQEIYFNKYQNVLTL